MICVYNRRLPKRFGAQAGAHNGRGTTGRGTGTGCGTGTFFKNK